jgi:multidrug efflux pump subunit AcrA (membrane-fusion protein)
MCASGAIRRDLSTAVTVPAESVVIRDGRSFVLRLAGTHAEQVAVSVGRREGGLAEILSGIKAGETVVVRGAGFVNDKDTVRIVPADGRAS